MRRPHVGLMAQASAMLVGLTQGSKAELSQPEVVNILNNELLMKERHGFTPFGRQRPGFAARDKRASRKRRAVLKQKKRNGGWLLR